MLRSPYFTELFLTKSRARPRLLFALDRGGEWSFFSSPQDQNPYDGKVTVGFHMKISKGTGDFGGLTSGLIYFSSLNMKDKDKMPVIYNPTTRQYVSLPELKEPIEYLQIFLGFDPFHKQFKVLSIVRPYREKRDHHRILTLETGTMSWRKIQCPLDHEISPKNEAICINGVLYYLAEKFDDIALFIVCFDVRSESFKIIDAGGYYNDDSIHELVNYKGKLGALYPSYGGDGKTLELSLWVLEDVEKQEWSKYVYILPDNEHFKMYEFSFAGVTAAGELAFAMHYTSKSKPFYVLYFNPERNTFQRVEIKDFGKYYHENRHGVSAFVDYVEDLHVNDAKYLSSQCLNISRKRPKLPKPH